MTANAVLGHILDTASHDDPAAILGEFNRQMKDALHHEIGDSVIDNGLDIGLCWCAPKDRRIKFAGARMELHYSSGGTLTTVSGDKQAIGYRSADPEYSYTNHTIVFEKGTCFCLASDGILDQAGGTKGLGFGRRRFSEILTASSHLPADGRKAALEDELARYQGEHPQRDDITVIGFRL
jgi:phosphoserine phosphatase RsbU/P